MDKAMSDNDPRLEVLRRSISYHLTPDGVAADLDAADRAAGIVRVDTGDEALVWHIVNERFPEWARSELEADLVRSELEADLVRSIFATLREASQ